MYIRFNICNQSIKRMDVNKVVADSRNYLRASFTFSDDWKGIKTAIFKNGDLIKHTLLENDECLVPWEVITEGKLRVSVFCDDLITADEVAVNIYPSGYEDGGSPEEPTPTVYEQIISMINDMQAGEIPESKIEEAVTKYLTEHPVESLTEADVQKIVADYVSLHKEDLKGDNGADGYTPVRGTDYWTAEDISEIHTYIDNQIGGALNGSY